MFPLPVDYGYEILRSEVGSTLHGTGLPDGEDHDEMGMFVERPGSTLGLRELAQYEYRTAREREKVEVAQRDPSMRAMRRSPRSGPGDTDLVVYTLRKWSSLALKGNPSVLLPLFAPEEKLVIATGLGRHLREHADWFISQRCGKAFLGYMKRQRARMTGDRGSAGRTRKSAEGGVDWKYAMHMVRLGFQGVEVMSTGRITLPVPGDTGDYLRRIRTGNVPLRDVIAAAASLEKRLEDLLLTSPLPMNPNEAKVNEFLIDAHLMVWGVDDAYHLASKGARA